MAEERMKVVVVGPSKSGKTCVTNFLSGARDTPTVDYKETSPLRVLEALIEGVRASGKRQVGRGTRITVEMWDVGGSSKFQACWPACYQNADAVIFVMNPEVRNQEKELELWYKSFAQPAGVPDKHCLVFCHHSSPPENSAIPQMTGSLRNIRVLETSLDFQSDNFKEAFDKLIETVLSSRREAEEEAALQQQNNAMNGPLLVGSSRNER